MPIKSPRRCDLGVGDYPSHFLAARDDDELRSLAGQVFAKLEKADAAAFGLALKV
jgi:hypothetical protein